MKPSGKTLVNAMILFLLLLAASPSWAEDKSAAAPSTKGLQQRIDFGNAHILGQSIKSGAVYLMHRKKSDIRSMLEVRQHYRNEIKEDFDLGDTAIIRGVAAPKKEDAR